MDRILIVDDKEENLYLMRALLQGHGYTVEEARHGADALVKARQNPPHLVISDLLMPVMDGYTLLKHWKIDEQLRSIPFVVYTATYTEPKDERLALDLGADMFIIKPVEPDILLIRLRELLAKQANGTLSASTFLMGEEDVLLKQYNEVLVRRLEAKMEQLTQTNRKLEQELIERKRAEKNLANKQTLLSTILDHLPVAIHVKDSAFRRRMANQVELNNLNATSEAAVLGKTDFDFYPQEQAALFNADDQRVLKTGQPLLNREEILTRPDGSVLYLLTSKAPLHDADGNVIGLVGISNDITQHKKLEAEFLRAQRLEGIGTLASGIAHDLNNILSPMILIPSYLEDNIHDPEDKEMLKTMEMCAKRGSDIIKQLLAFAHGTPGVHIPLVLRHLLNDMKRIIQETFPREISTIVNVPDELSPVMGDATQIQQVLMNLCVNARDAMSNGGTLTLQAMNLILDESFVAMTPHAKPGPYVCLIVSDTGVGIAPENIDRIFDPFFTTKEIGKGTGLGLSTVVGIVRGHEGFVKVDSHVGRGTTFEIYFPAAPEAKILSIAGSKTLSPAGRGELVLVVDDEVFVRETVQRTLEAHGYRIITASHGKEGLEVFSRHRNDVRLVITDMMMPIMNGPAMIKELRAIDPRLPILGITGISDRTGIQDFDKIEFSAFLMKPFTREELLQTLHKALAIKETVP